MGSSHSIQDAREVEDEEEDDDDDQEPDEEDDDLGRPDGLVPSERADLSKTLLVKKVLEQEPEILPCHASASPLSPQLSSLGTPRMGPSIKVWDPYNVLSPMPPPMPPPPSMIPNAFVGNYPGNGMMEEDRDQRGSGGDRVVEVYLVSEGESEVGVRRGEVVVGGSRWKDAELTGNGKRQARALAVLLSSRGVRFGRVFSSPVERAKEMAGLICREMNFSEDQIQLSEALADMSQGIWEGCSLSEIYTPEILGLMDRLQPDFAAPSGESLREVEFRIIQFLNRTVLGLPEKLQPSDHPSQQNLHSLSNLARHRPNFPKKKSGKSRLQFVTYTGDHPDMEDDNSPQDACGSEYSLNGRSSDGASSSVGIFTHSLPIKCVVTGLLGCSPAMANRISIDDSSVTVLQHSWTTGSAGVWSEGTIHQGTSALHYACFCD
ncbi:hypothetical protein MLD38_013281 [Melastoma candidum]|uniref:Uncharacterized protein n=1 Tax=Melastoma candidum TaxID=119954 RepID=A0ACB9RCQ6_9MYRT|nr:hypothetical protein MLD38_013281 [Melastoma candidum]